MGLVVSSWPCQLVDAVSDACHRIQTVIHFVCVTRAVFPMTIFAVMMSNPTLTRDTRLGHVIRRDSGTVSLLHFDVIPFIFRRSSPHMMMMMMMMMKSAVFIIHDNLCAMIWRRPDRELPLLTNMTWLSVLCSC